MLGEVVKEGQTVFININGSGLECGLGQGEVVDQGMDLGNIYLGGFVLKGFVWIVRDK